MKGGERSAERVFQTPATEYRKVLTDRRFDCLMSLEDVFNEAFSAAAAQRNTQSKPAFNPSPHTFERPAPTQWTGESFYRDLQLEANCEQGEITAAYRRLAAVHHPDKGGDTAQFQRIQHAYETLRDPQKRKHYDEFGPNPPFLS